MKFYEIIIRPVSGFGTALKGDTLFGHFCWQAAYDPSLIEGGLERALAQYTERPFAVFASACPRLEGQTVRYLLKRPDLPISWLFGAEGASREARYESMKEHKNQKWMLLDRNLAIDFRSVQFLSDQTLSEEAIGFTPEDTRCMTDYGFAGRLLTTFLQPHNTINRLTGTTGIDEFAPYSVDGYYYYPGIELAVFVLVDEEMTNIDKISDGLDRIGRFGFGKDASTGMGRFEVLETNELFIPDNTDADACYTLSPCVPEHFEGIYFTPFVRYGKHGDRLATSENPFKNPVIMADEAAVLVFEKGQLDKPFVGRAVAGVSKVQPEAVVQGYSPYLPVKLEH